jgi:signal transduction histidine kinase
MSLVREKNTTKKRNTQMTRKDYIKIAEALNAATADHAQKFCELTIGEQRLMTRIVNELSEVFANDNPRFNLGRFEDAVKLPVLIEFEDEDAVDRLEAAMDEYRKAVA